MEAIKIIVSNEENNTRIDKFLSNHLSDVSRTSLKNWIKDGYVLVNDKKVKSSTKVFEDDIVSYTTPDPIDTDIKAEDIPLNVVYEDSDVIVVNKESGMIVHPSSGIYSGTLVNALLYHCKDLSGINGVNRPGIVHRIDKETSGLLMVAKNDNAHQSLASQLEEHTVIRRYVALVHGTINHNKGRIVAPIGRDEKDRQKMSVTARNSKDAITNFVVLERFKDYTLVECRLETGRTHQIRVHMQYIGHPVYGDPKYGYRHDDITHGQYLHAKKLGFVHPSTNEEVIFDSNLPYYMEEKIKELRGE